MLARFGIARQIAVACQKLNTANILSVARVGTVGQVNTISARQFSVSEQVDANETPATEVGESNVDNDNSIHNFNLDASLVRTLDEEFKIKNFFPIQAKVMKPIQDGRDVVGKSKTGTGKTLAFLLPFIDRIVKQNYPRPASTQATILVLEPTRELANQVGREVEKLDPRILSTVIYGGVGYESQIRELRRGCHVVVATPGRLKDLMASGHLDLSSVEAVILDEADEMLKFGFMTDIKTILADANPNRQSIFFSATYNKSITELIERSVKDHVFIDCAAEGSATPSLITHKAACLPDTEYVPAMISALMASFSAQGRVMIFVDKKQTASELEIELNRYAEQNNLGNGRKYAAAIHGDVTQAARENALQRFRQGSLTALVATDVAARGIDIPDVNLVIHVGIPNNYESYVHRSGRTGRAGKTGTSVLLYRYSERRAVAQLSGATSVRFSQVLSSDLNAVSLDTSITKKLYSNISKTAFFVQNKQNDDYSSEIVTPYVAAKDLYSELTVQHSPENIAIAAIETLIKQQTQSTTASFSILRSSPNCTTIAFADNHMTRSSVQKALSEVTKGINIDINFILSSSKATYVDIPDDIAELVKFGLEEGTLSNDDIAIPTRLPNEFFAEGSDRNFGGNRGGYGGNRGGYGGNRGGYNNRGDGGDRGGYNSNRGDRGGFGGDRGDRGGYGGDRGGYNSNRGERSGYGGNRGGERGGYNGNRGGNFGSDRRF